MVTPEQGADIARRYFAENETATSIAKTYPGLADGTIRMIARRYRAQEQESRAPSDKCNAAQAMTGKPAEANLPEAGATRGEPAEAVPPPSKPHAYH